MEPPEDSHTKESKLDNTGSNNCENIEGENSKTGPTSNKNTTKATQSQNPTQNVKENQDDVSFKKPLSFTFKKPSFIGKIPKAGRKIKLPALGELDIKGDPKAENSSEANNTSSPAQQLAENSAPIPYKEPGWSGLPTRKYSFEVLKGGVIVETKPLDKPYIVVGRQSQSCDILMGHPSISRYHCVVQFRATGTEEQPIGFYIYDLESTHGTFQNKYQIKPKVYYRLHVGHILKFGGSSRMFILQGPPDDQEPESELSVSELRASAAERAERLQKLEDEDKSGKSEKEGFEKKVESKDDDNEGISWGMGEDAAEEEGEDEGGGKNPFATGNEELYLDDPKKTLRGWFEREGYDLPNYETKDLVGGKYQCRVELPLSGPGGGALVAFAEHKGKKKDCVVQCAMEACRLLDKHGVLRQAKHESHEKKKKNWTENDYYDSDEDDFLDRTGDIQKKRIKRMNEAAVGSTSDSEVQTYDSLIVQYNEVLSELKLLEKKLNDIEKLKQQKENASRDKKMMGRETSDELDSYMAQLESQVPDKHKRVTWKLKVVDLKKQELNLRKLVNIAKPAGVADIQPYQSIDTKDKDITVKQIGDSKRRIMKPVTSSLTRLSTTVKNPCIGVHKSFIEEEPVRKLRLSRLNDDDDDVRPVPYAKSAKKEHDAKESLSKNQKATPSESSQKNGKNKALPLEFTKSTAVSSITGNLNNSIDKLKNNQEESSKPSDKTPAEIPVTIISSSSNERGDEELPLDPPEKKIKIMGPSLPPSLEWSKPSKQNSETTTDMEKDTPKKKKAKYKIDESKYDMWVPPKNQTGDGKTDLNKKLGY